MSDRNTRIGKAAKSTVKVQSKVKKAADKEVEVLKDDDVIPVCPDCKDSVLETDKALTCDVCQNWFHIQEACQNVPINVYEYFEQGATQIFWYCKICSAGARNLMQIINKTQQDINEVKKRVSTVEEDVKKRSTKKDHDELETQVKNQNTLIEQMGQKIDAIEKKAASAAPQSQDNEQAIDKKIRDLKDEDARK